MSQDAMQKLTTVADEADLDELNLAKSGRDSAMQAYQKKPGKATKEDYEAARQMLDDVMQRLGAKYFPDESAAPEGERFKNRKQAHDWLVKQGYKVSRGKFYGDCDEGSPQVHRDGSVSRFQVMEYGQALGADRGAAITSDESKRKEKLELRKLELDVRKREREDRKDDAKWMYKDDAWAAIAGLIGTLRDSLRHHFHAGQGELIHMAGGDQNRGPEVYEGCEEIMARAFNEVCAAKTIHGIFAVDEDESE